MSTTGRLFTDGALDRVLDQWLSDGPTAMPEASLDAALQAVAVTPQRRWRGRLVHFTGASPLVPVGLTLAAVAAVVALGVGLGQALPLPGTEATPTPGPTDTPTPDATNPQPGWVDYTNEEDGYELTLPSALAATPHTPQLNGNPAPGVRGFGVGLRWIYAVAISAGQPDGSITLCGIIENGSTTACHSVTVTSLDDLEEALISTSDATLRATEYHADVSLGGLPARVEAIRPGGLVLGPPAFHHVYAIRDGRPIVLSFDEWTLRNHLDNAALDRILASFRLTRPDDSDSTTWKTVELANAGFTVDIPSDWAVDAGDDSAIVMIRGAGGSVRVSLGDQDGQIPLCLVLAPCQLVEAASIDDLIGVVRGEYRVHWGIRMSPTVRIEQVTIDGAAGTRVTVSPPGGMTGPGTSRSVVFIRNERAVILQWGPDFSVTPLWDEIISSIRFID